MLRVLITLYQHNRSPISLKRAQLALKTARLRCASSTSNQQDPAGCSHAKRTTHHSLIANVLTSNAKD